MSFASAGTVCTMGNFTDAATMNALVGVNCNVGELLLIAISANNTSTTDGDNSEVSSVTDFQSNTWEKCGEITNGEGAAAAGAICSVWRSIITTQLVSGVDRITVTFVSNRLDRVASVWKFTRDTAQTVQLAAAAVTNVTDASNGFGSAAFSGLPSKEYLFFRGLAKEANSTTGLTVSSGYTTITAARSRNDAASMMVRGEFIITTATGSTSNPTLAVSGDTAGVFVALEEITVGGGMLRQMMEQHGG